MLGKTEVNGDNAAPIWKWLKDEMPGFMGLKRIKWNFEKFLISADGKVVGRWASTTGPASLEEPIVKEIEKAKQSGTLAAAATAAPTTTADAPAPAPADAPVKTEEAKLA